jgi:leucyl-tRNA synthetase
VDVNMVRNDILDTEAFRKWKPEYADAEFILENCQYHCGWAVEKMSKSMWNVVNPDQIIEQYGADTLRLYEMFLGPIDQAKPWDTNGIEGVHKFLRKFWRLFFDSKEQPELSNAKTNKNELKVLHKTIKKIQEDIERFSFNTSVSAFMICLNELNDLKCNKRAILEPLVILLAPFAPHIAEEIWSNLGHQESVTVATFPVFDEKYLKEDTVTYPVSFNGKTRFSMDVPANYNEKQVEKAALSNEACQKWLEGKTPKKIIIVLNKIVNIVV